jgi:hypothetical protein
MLDSAVTLRAAGTCHLPGSTLRGCSRKTETGLLITNRIES